jgi:hypothetical protein
MRPRRIQHPQKGASSTSRKDPTSPTVSQANRQMLACRHLKTEQQILQAGRRSFAEDSMPVLLSDHDDAAQRSSHDPLPVALIRHRCYKIQWE